MTKPSESATFQNLQVFHDVARSLASSDLDSILAAIMKQAVEFFQPEAWSLLLVQENHQSLRSVLSAGRWGAGSDGAAGPGKADGVAVPAALGEGVAGWVAQHGQPVWAPEAATDSRFAPGGIFTSLPDLLAAPLPVRSVMCVPLRSREKVLGVILLLNCPGAAVTEYTVSFLNVLADYAAIAVQNAHAMRRIQELTITDDCTLLYNSRHLTSVLEGEIERSRRFHLPFSLIFMDLDHFKWINDRHGHLVGSWVLGKLAETIKHSIRGIDSAFRYGGDEFIILLPQTGKDAAVEVAQRLLHATRESSYVRSEQLAISVRASFGLASYPDDGSTAHQIICAADQMMYLVKNSTRNNIAIAQRGILSRREFSRSPNGRRLDW